MIWVDHTAKFLNLKQVAIEQSSTRKVVMAFTIAVLASCVDHVVSI